MKTSTGFTLLELVLVIAIIGIIAAATGPFLGKILSGPLEIRRMNEREQQATLALESFVRDFRAAEDFHSTNKSLSMNYDEIVYDIDDNSGILFRKGQVLARHVHPESEFHTDSEAGYDVMVLTLKIQMNSENTREFSAAAVRRGSIHDK